MLGPGHAPQECCRSREQSGGGDFALLSRPRGFRGNSRLSWQVNPGGAILGELFSDSNPEKSKRAMEALLKMKKISILGLKRAYERR